MRNAVSRTIGPVLAVAVLMAAQLATGVRRGNRDDNFGALLTSDRQPKVAASVLAR